MEDAHEEEHLAEGHGAVAGDRHDGGGEVGGRIGEGLLEGIGEEFAESGKSLFFVEFDAINAERLLEWKKEDFDQGNKEKARKEERN